MASQSTPPSRIWFCPVLSLSVCCSRFLILDSHSIGKTLLSLHTCHTCLRSLICYSGIQQACCDHYQPMSLWQSVSTSSSSHPKSTVRLHSFYNSPGISQLLGHLLRIRSISHTQFRRMSAFSCGSSNVLLCEKEVVICSADTRNFTSYTVV